MKKQTEQFELLKNEQFTAAKPKKQRRSNKRPDQHQQVRQRTLEVASGLAVFEYPEPYRNHNLIATQVEGKWSDRLGDFSAITWSCWAYGEKHYSVIISMGLYRRNEAIAIGMQFLDSSYGESKGHRGIDSYNEAIARINKLLLTED